MYDIFQGQPVLLVPVLVLEHSNQLPRLPQDRFLLQTPAQLGVVYLVQLQAVIMCLDKPLKQPLGLEQHPLRVRI